MYVLGVVFVAFFVCLVVLGLMYWSHQLYYGLKSERIMFIPTDLSKVDNHLLTIIPKYISDTSEFDLVELGCGNGKVLRFLNSNFKWKNAIGVEFDFVSTAVATILSFGSKVKIINDNIHTYKISNNSLVYCFLGTEILDQLYKDGQFKNHLVISLEFPITDIDPTETNLLEDFTIEKQIYVYDFRK